MDNTTLLGIKAGIAAVAGTLTAVWGWFGWLVVAWVGLMLSDWLIGSAAAAKEGRWASSKMREGAWHKGGMILVVCIALVADWLIGSILGHIPELGSLAEHAVTFGAPVPSWLVNILDISKNAVDAAGEKLTGGEETSESAGDGSGDTTTKD